MRGTFFLHIIGFTFKEPFLNQTPTILFKHVNIYRSQYILLNIKDLKFAKYTLQTSSGIMFRNKL